jgi:N-acetylmuramoyl-L-alanine amidase
VRRILSFALVIAFLLVARGADAVSVATPRGPAEVFARGDLFDLVELIRLTGAEVAFAPAAGSYTALLGAHEVQFTPGGSLAVIDGKLATLSGPVRLLEGRTVGSLSTANELLAALGWGLRGSAAAPELAPLSAGERIEVAVVRDEVGTLLVVRGTAQRPRMTTAGAAVSLHFDGPVAIDRPIEAVGELETGELRDNTLTLRFLPGYEVANTYQLRDPPRFVLRIAPAQKPAPAGTQGVSRGGPLVVLDPGHGGEDQGATGPGGELEKNLTLAVARLTAGRLQAMGVATRLTREGDEGIPLHERTALANRLRADVFVSIHANASQAKGARGAETYFMNADASDPQAAQAADRENASASPDTVQLILWDLAHVANLDASSRLALAVQERLNAIQETRDRGIKQAPFVVLTGATMPAALVEIGFLSNPAETTRLTSAEGQDQIAAALAEAIAAYLRPSEPAASPSATP